MDAQRLSITEVLIRPPLFSSLDYVDYFERKIALERRNQSRLCTSILNWWLLCILLLTDTPGNLLRCVWKVIACTTNEICPTWSSKFIDTHRCDPRRKSILNTSMNGRPAWANNSKFSGVERLIQWFWNQLTQDFARRIQNPIPKQFSVQLFMFYQNVVFVLSFFRRI